MYVAAVIVEQLEADGRIKRLTMEGGSAHQLTVAFPEEYAGECSGPFFFPNEDDEAKFKKDFADCKFLKLTKHFFTARNGDYNLRIQRGGIPTEGQLSYYSLSLPEFAVPTEITLKDPHSNEPLYKSVYRDKLRKRFVIYVECRSGHGVFDFLLEVRFKFDRDKFPGAEYPNAEFKDDYLSKYGGQINAYKRLLPSDQERTVRSFFSGEGESSEAKAARSSPARRLAADSGILFSDQSNEDDLADRERRGRDCDEIVQEVKKIRGRLGHGLTIFEIRKEHPEYQIWKVVSSLPKEDQDVFEHPGQWGNTVSYTYGLLGKAYDNRSPFTVRDWVKEYRHKHRLNSKK
jgi:hypothetical protein